jgi:hypothetical protein
MHYPDKWPRLIGIPIWAFFFRFIGDITPLGDLLKSPQFYMDIGVIVGVTWLLWEGNRFLIRSLDKKYSWVTNAIPRLFVQGGIAFGSTTLIIALFSFVYNDLLLQRPLEATLSILIANDVPIGLLFIVLLHMGYTMYWMLNYHRHTVAALHLRIAELEATSQPALLLSQSSVTGPKTLLVNQGKGMVPLAAERIAYIFVTNETSIVKTTDNQSYTIDATLEQLGERLPAPDFFRINRQFLTHRQAIQKVENDGSGRWMLHLLPKPAEAIAVSRRRAAEFRQWLGEA